MPRSGNDWSEADSRRLARLIRDMVPYRAILAEFPERSMRSVRLALIRALTPPNVGLDRAASVLGTRAAPARRAPCGYLLDGRPASSRLLIGEANTVLRSYRMPAIRYPEAGA